MTKILDKIKALKKDTSWFFIFFVVVIFILGGLAFYGIYQNYLSQNESIRRVFGRVNPLPTQPPLLSTDVNIVVLGYGGAGHDGGALTDTIILSKVDPIKKAVTLISIPRDIWLPLPIKGEEKVSDKINAAYAIGVDDDQFLDRKDIYKGKNGGGNLAKYAVGVVTGMPVDYYIAINFEGFKKIIDIMGGVEVEVPYTFDDYFYPIKGLEDDTCGKSEEEITSLTATISGELLEKQFPCRYEHLHFDRGMQVLNGETALKFVRSRHSAVGGSDFGRAIRQQALITAVKDEMLALRDPIKIVAVAAQLVKNVQTDINIKAAFDFTKKQQSVSDITINTISLNDENVLTDGINSIGQFILIPKSGEDNWSGVHDYIKTELEKFEGLNTPNPSPSPLKP